MLSPGLSLWGVGKCGGGGGNCVIVYGQIGKSLIEGRETKGWYDDPSLARKGKCVGGKTVEFG